MALSVRRRDINRRAARSSASAELGRSLRIGRIGLDTTRMLGRRDDGLPVYTYEAVPGVPLVSATRLGRELSPGGLPHVHPHSHDFLVLTYFERGGGSMWLGKREWRIEAGDAHVIAPGEVVGVGDASGLEEAEGWGVFFPPESHAGSRVARRQRSLVQPPLFAHHTGRSSAPQRHRRPHLLRDGHATVRLSPHRRG